MKLIESKAEYIPQEEGLGGIYKAIELAGRTAYNSQDKITPDSAKNFVDRMIKSHHGAALEHGTVYLRIPVDNISRYRIALYIGNPYSKTSPGNLDDNCEYIVSNLRVLQEHNWLDDLRYLCSSTKFHEKRYTMRFTCSRAIAQELTRHRTFSFLMESQRYINYSKKRHGGELSVIIPSWCTSLIENNSYDLAIAKMCGESEDIPPLEQRFIMSMCFAEEIYMEYLEDDMQPQQARDVLPNATKTELIMTGFSSDWRFLMDLRLFEKTGKVHPDMKDLMQKAQKAMQEASIWEDIVNKPSKFE